MSKTQKPTIKRERLSSLAAKAAATAFSITNSLCFNFEEIRCNRSTTKSLLLYAYARRSSGFFNDVTISVGKARIPANKMVLACFSKYFEDLLINRQAIKIDCDDEDSVKQIVDFIYTGSITINGRNVCSLLTLSVLLKIQEVKKFCEAFLKKAITPDNCVQVMKFAKLHESQVLITDSEEIIGKNFNKDFITKELNDLTNDEMSTCVSNLRLRGLVKEATLFETVIRWTKYDVAHRTACLPNLLRSTKLEKWSLDFLDDEKFKHVVLENNELCDLLLHEQTTTLKEIRDMELGKSIISIGGVATPSEVTEVFNCDNNPPAYYPEMPENCQKKGCVVLLKDYLYHIGGYNPDKRASTNAVHRMDIKVELTWRKVCPMMQARVSPATTALNRVLVVTGGWDDGNDLSSGEYYTLETKSWHNIHAMQKYRAQHALVACSGSLYAVGGVRNESHQTSVEFLSDVNGAWTLLKPLQVPRRWFSAVSCNGHLYVIGGEARNNEVTLNSVEMYNSVSDSWSNISDMRCRRVSSSACVLQGRIFVVGGLNERKQAVKQIECYDPLFDQWSVACEIDEELHGHSTVVV